MRANDVLRHYIHRRHDLALLSARPEAISQIKDFQRSKELLNTACTVSDIRLDHHITMQHRWKLFGEYVSSMSPKPSGTKEEIEAASKVKIIICSRFSGPMRPSIKPKVHRLHALIRSEIRQRNLINDAQEALIYDCFRYSTPLSKQLPQLRDLRFPRAEQLLRPVVDFHPGTHIYRVILGVDGLCGNESSLVLFHKK